MNLKQTTDLFPLPALFNFLLFWFSTFCSSGSLYNSELFIPPEEVKLVFLIQKREQRVEILDYFRSRHDDILDISYLYGYRLS